MSIGRRTNGDSHLAGRRVLATGASGFIGSRLVDRLNQAGAEVHAVSRTGCPDDAGSVRWWRADLAELDATVALIASIEPELVFHLGGNVSGQPSPELVLPTIKGNLLTTISVLEAVRQVGCHRVVVPVSVVEPELGPDEAPPPSPYAASKWASWGYARMFHALWDVPAAILRVTMVYGPGQSDPRKLIPHIVVSLLNGSAPSLTSGRDQFDWVYIDDVVDALLVAAATPDIEGETVDIGSGHLTSVREIAEGLGGLINRDVELAFGDAPDRPLPPPARVANAARTGQVLGWKATTALDEGLERTVDWFRSRMPLGFLVLAQALAAGQLPASG
jgi:nucleoside-diphosphate-sugar epimerase